jgi:hypothetical protein
MRFRTILVLLASIIGLTGHAGAAVFQSEPTARMTPFPNGGLGYGRFKEEPSDKAGYRKFTAGLSTLFITGTVISIVPATPSIAPGEPKLPYRGVYLGKYCWFFHTHDFSFKARPGAARSIVYVPQDVDVPPVFLQHTSREASPP